MTIIIKIPKKISIGSHDYNVIFDEREDDSAFLGSASHRRHEIRLNPNCHPQQRRVTFLHEVQHMINETFEVHPPEDDVSRLAEGMGQFLFSNLDIDFDFSDIPTREVKRERG